MRRLKKLLQPIGLAAIAIAAMTFGVRAADPPEFKPDGSFKGSTLTGWHVVGQAEWRAENGELVGRAAAGGNGGWLVMDKAFQDLMLYANLRCEGACKTGRPAARGKDAGRRHARPLRVADGRRLRVLPSHARRTRRRDEPRPHRRRSPRGRRRWRWRGWRPRPVRRRRTGGSRCAAAAAVAGAAAAPARRCESGGGGHRRQRPPTGAGAAAPGGGGGAAAVAAAAAAAERPSRRSSPASGIRSTSSSSADTAARVTWAAADRWPMPNTANYGAVALYIGGTGEVRYKDVAWKDLNTLVQPKEQVSSRFTREPHQRLLLRLVGRCSRHQSRRHHGHRVRPVLLPRAVVHRAARSTAPSRVYNPGIEYAARHGELLGGLHR